MFLSYMSKKFLNFQKYKLFGFGCFFSIIIYYGQIFFVSNTFKQKAIADMSSIPMVRLNIHELSSEEPYLSRILRIRNECSKKSKKPELTETKTTFKYVDKISLVMCETPKVASTTWQLVLLRLSGYKENFKEEITKKWAYNMIPNQTFKNLSVRKIWEIMSSYTTFLVTRHPFERLVSAYFDKLSNQSSFGFYRNKIGKQIAKAQASEHMHGLQISHFRNNFTKAFAENLTLFQSLSPEKQKDVLKYLKVIQTGEVTFRQFVKYLGDYARQKSLNAMDIHWRPQSLLCQPCLFNYSYVIKFENLSNESNRLLDYLQRSYNLSTSLIQQLRFIQKVIPKTRKELTNKTIRLIPESQVETLRKIYRDDFRLYGYDPYSYKGF